MNKQIQREKEQDPSVKTFIHRYKNQSVSQYNDCLRGMLYV